MNKAKGFLKKNNVKFRVHKHPPVYTCKDAEKYYLDIPGPVFKSLFLKSKNGDQYFMAVLPAEKRVDFDKFAELAGVKRVSLANKDDLMEILAVEPGSVSPFSLINDDDSEVMVYIDKSIDGAEIVSFHPNINTETLELDKDAFNTFLGLIGNNFEIVDF